MVLAQHYIRNGLLLCNINEKKEHLFNSFTIFLLTMLLVLKGIEYEFLNQIKIIIANSLFTF